MSKCTRNFYEHPVHIRNAKLTAAEGGFADLMKNLKARDPETGKTAAIVGGGPAGMAAAFFLSRAGFAVTLYEKEDSLGGVVKHVIPGFRISDEAIAHDVALVTAYGAKLQLNTKIENLDSLKDAYDYVVLAAGASEPGVLKLEKGEPVNALEFLADFKKHDGNLDLGKNVVVIGGGNTAMDTARAAKRTKGVEHVYLVYRRTKRYMPADEEELVMAVEDGVEFKELLAPKAQENGMLLCDVMKLGEMDASGRRGVVATGETVSVPADTIIAAVGEKVPTHFYEACSLNLNDRGKVLVNPDTKESSVKNVYVIGDGLGGPATVVEAIRDALTASEAIAGRKLVQDFDEKVTSEDVYPRRGSLLGTQEGRVESGRCLSCSSICENCAEVCPNRANLAIRVPGMTKHQIIHVDYMCNECGNCRSFCPYDSAPYLDKFTLFANVEDMDNSKNEGFTVLNKAEVSCRVRYLGNIIEWKSGEKTEIPEALCKVMETVCRDYEYLIQ